MDPFDLLLWVVAGSIALLAIVVAVILIVVTFRSLNAQRKITNEIINDPWGENK